MIELAQHIEKLLLDNDCVIVPGLGGFVAHYTPSVRIEKDHLFLPPTRVIGFNPQVKMNDGLLVQSYMEVYNTSFSDATHIVNKQVDELTQCLHEEGRADLPNVGELHCSIQGMYEFTPYNNKITTPRLYGLTGFEMKALDEIRTASSTKAAPDYGMATDGRRRRERKIRLEINIKPSYWLNAAAMIAIIMLFFLLSTPIANTEVAKGNYASLFPDDIFETMKKQSVAFTPIATDQPVMQKTKPSQTGATPVREKPKEMKAQVVAKEVKVKEQEKAAPAEARPSKKDARNENEIPKAVSAVTKKYHIIVASVMTENDAHKMAERLIEKGFKGASAIIGNERKRVSIESCATYAEAQQTLNEIRKNEAYKNAWILKQ